MKHQTTKIILTLLTTLIILSFSACSIFRATGKTVSAVGEGAGHAVAGTGRAISNAADEGL